MMAMMSPMPKSSIDLMSCFGTVPRAPITTGGMAVSACWILYLKCYVVSDASQLSSPLF